MTGLIDSAGMVIHVLIHLSWWWIVNLKLTQPRLMGLPLSIGYLVFVGWVSTDFNLLAETPAQSPAFAGLVASAIKLVLWKTNPQFENVAACFSLVATSFIVVSSALEKGDPLYFSHLWLLGCCVVLWIHTRIANRLEQPIPWLNTTGTFLMYAGMVLAISSLVLLLAGMLFPGFIRDISNDDRLGAALSYVLFLGAMLAGGVIGAGCGSLGITFNLLSNPNPKWQLIVVCFAVCCLAVATNVVAHEWMSW
ncbi:MAG: hypothetical protein ACR2NP_12600 [Pirellulaceae bacterium]